MADNIPVIHKAYATRIISHFKMIGSFDAGALGEKVLSLPFAGQHVVSEDIEYDSLPRIGETLSVKDHMNATFFDIVNNDAPLTQLTRPILIRSDFLEGLDYWIEWRTLRHFLESVGLFPLVVFRNTPIRRGGTYYLADTRVVIAISKRKV